MPTIFVAALLVVALQLNILPLLKAIFGEVSYNEVLIVFATYAGMLIGLSGIGSRISFRHSHWLIGLILILIGAFYSSLVLWGAKSFINGALLVITLELLLVWAGNAMATAVYDGAQPVRNYFWLNTLCLIWIFLLMLITMYAGADASFFVAGLLVLLYRPGSRQMQIKKLIANRETLRSVLLGIIGSGFVSLYFVILYHGLYPTFFAFPLYLILTFLFLAVGSSLLPRFKLSSDSVITIALVLFFVVILFLPIHEIVQWVTGNQLNSNNAGPFFIYVALFMIMLFLPYLFIAGVVPLRELEKADLNHLFWVTLGNCLGFLAFGLLLLEVPLGIKIALLFLLGAIVARRHWVRLTLIVIGLSLGLNFHDDKLEQAYVKMGLHAFLGQGNISLRHFHRSRGQTGYLFNFGNVADAIGLGGYFAFFSSPVDLYRGIIVHELIQHGHGKNVLVLGLGNHLPLKLLEGLNVNIDVVDNFGPFADQKFLDDIAGETGFSWQNTKANLYLEDAFNFLSRSSKKYDVIYWNLSFSIYSSSGKLHSIEFMKLMKQHLAPEGVVAVRNFSSQALNCLFESEFQKTYLFPLSANLKESGILLFSPEENNLLLQQSSGRLDSYCEPVPKITLAMPYLTLDGMRSGVPRTNDVQILRNTDKPPQDLWVSRMLADSIIQGEKLNITAIAGDNFGVSTTPEGIQFTLDNRNLGDRINQILQMAFKQKVDNWNEVRNQLP